ncbi:MAG TPA: hypothetical protein VGN35_09340 [Jatrophihabitantaceae bacterium]|nr:hypothetical protein [Jatrophihabitantaceae bacterium]
MNTAYTHAFVVQSHQDRLAVAEHARTVKAARAGSKPWVARVPLRLPRIRLRPVAGHGQVAAGAV